MAAIALLRLHHYTGDEEYRDKAEQTLETFAGVAEQFGIFAGTYGIAVTQLLESPVQVVVIDAGEGDGKANDFETLAQEALAFNKSVLRLTSNQAVTENLPPALAATIPNIPLIRENVSFVVLCSGFSCQPPVTNPSQLKTALGTALKAST